MKAVLRGEHTSAARGATTELQRGFVRLRARAGEQHAREPLGCAAQELLREQARKQRHTELNGSRRLQLERFDECGADTRIVPSDVEHAEAGEQVETPVAVAVVEVLRVGARPDPVEADRPQHAHELRIDRLRVELVVLAGARLEELADHGLSLAGSRMEKPRRAGLLPCRWTCELLAVSVAPAAAVAGAAVVAAAAVIRVSRAVVRAREARAAVAGAAVAGHAVAGGAVARIAVDGRRTRLVARGRVR